MTDDIQNLVTSYPAWQLVENTLVGEWKFADFSEVSGVVAKLCDIADELNHHPTVTYGYNTIKVETTTHDAGNTVTDKDVELARLVSAILEN